MVTKQEQLKWLAKRFESLPFDSDSILMSDEVLGYLGHEHKITNQELKQERYKMSRKPEVDNSWHERGELPPVGCECEVKTKTFNGWMRCFVVGKSSRGDTVIECDDCAFIIDSSYEFRPLRTEREKAIDEMVSAILDYDGYMITSATAELVAKQLHDSGYHR